MSLEIIRAADQDRGAFDNGKITERKPVNFLGQGTATQRYGPLLYWAWAASTQGGKIDEHPHRGFEIFSYVLQGKLEHQDSLGSWKSLEPGALQVMQANSGLYHSERFAEGEHTEMFQIWLEPDLRESVQRQPVYADYGAESFSWQEHEGYRLKPMIGKNAPVQLAAAAEFGEVVIDPDGVYLLSGAAQIAVLLAIAGDGEIGREASVEKLGRGDVAILDLQSGGPCHLRAHDQPWRLAQLIVPAHVAYPLYPNH